MSDTGLIRGSSAVDDTSAGGFSINNKGNVIDTNTSTFADISTNGSNSYYCAVTGFGLSVPSGATINGIDAVFSARRSGPAGSFNNIKIIKGGTIVGTGTNIANGTLTTSQADYTVGSSSDLWGQSWTDTDVNASNFGIAFNMFRTAMGTPNCYDIHLRVYYTAGSSSFSHTATGGIAFSGLAINCSPHFFKTGTGGIVFGGSASASMPGLLYSHTATGGITFSGSAISSPHFFSTGTGGITFSGAAISSPHFFNVATGGITFSGNANWTGHFHHTASGNSAFFWSGSCGLKIGRRFTGVGGITFGGSAGVAIANVASMEGGVEWFGQLEAIPVLSMKGSIAWFGNAKSWGPNYEQMRGKIRWGGRVRPS